MAKHAITSFSYPLKEIDTVEEAENLAKADGKSLSQLILRLLKEEISTKQNQKKVKGSPNPLNIYSLIPEEKPLQQPTLEMWMREVQEARGNLNRLRQIEAASYTVHKEVMVSIKQEQNKRIFSK